MKRCEKSPSKDKNLPVEPIVANAANQQATGNARGISDRRFFPSALFSGY